MMILSKLYALFLWTVIILNHIKMISVDNSDLVKLTIIYLIIFFAEDILFQSWKREQ